MGNGRRSEASALLEFRADPLVRRRDLELGRIERLLEGGGVLVMLGEGSDARRVVARTLVALEEEEVGREVALAFEDADAERPLVLGVISGSRPVAPVPVGVRQEGETLILESSREITLRCGKASFTLQADGKVVVRGSHLLSRSSGPMRLKGASVSIN